jgi:hypothetical protein
VIPIHRKEGGGVSWVSKNGYQIEWAQQQGMDHTSNVASVASVQPTKPE